MLIIGLTGSIGMGKSTAARLFAEMGLPVHDADAAVHQLYGGAAAALVEAAFPGVSRDGRIDRALLAKQVLGNPEALRRLESIVHPLVTAHRADFLASATTRHARMAVFDIPLLFETGSEGLVDLACVVSAPFDVQKQRVLDRPGMTEERFRAILATQMPDADKRRRAHFVIDSSRGIDAARVQIGNILRSVSAMTGRERA